MQALEISEEAVGCTVEVGLSGVPFTEELVYYVRRCCEKAEAAFAARLRWTVRVERDDGRSDAWVDVTARRHDGHQVAVRAQDLDELLAVQSAFALLSEQLSLDN